MVKLLDRSMPLEFISGLSKREANSKKPIYQIHKWFARKTDAIFRSILLSLAYEEEFHEDFKNIYYSSNSEALIDKVILDPFAGGGTTLVNALRLGGKAIGVDINPMAWFIMKNELQVPAEEFNKVKSILAKSLLELEESIGAEIKKHYRTKVYDRELKEHREVDVLYVFWVKKCRCPFCSTEIKMFPKYKLTNFKKKKHSNFSVCPKCGEIGNCDDRFTTCESCGCYYDSSIGTCKGRNVTCPECKRKINILKEIVSQYEEPLQMEMYAIEYYDEVKKVKGFKKPDYDDVLRYQDIDAKLNKLKNENYKFIPHTIIPDGYNTQQIKNHNYRLWNQMFNSRQLYFLSKLLENINKIEDEIVKEIILCIFSNTLNANNMFCIYNTHYGKLEPLFGDHHMAPVWNPVENNVWGTKLGRGSFTKYFQSLLESKQFNFQPFERSYEDNKNTNIYIKEERVMPTLMEKQDFFSDNRSDLILSCSSSDDLSFIPNSSVDAVVTDPPYYGAINYSEITEFFYSWCRIILKDKYEFFTPEHIHNAGEVTVNDKLGIKKDDFIKRLTSCFLEIKRVLKPESPLILTYNHSSAQGWSVLMKAVLDSGFSIVQTYPVHAELRAGLVDSRRDKMNYDLIIVARPKMKSSVNSISWMEFMEEAYNGFEIVHARLEKENLSSIDRKLIQAGKVFELYSKYYPHIYKDEKLITFEEVLKTIYD